MIRSVVAIVVLVFCAGHSSAQEKPSYILNREKTHQKRPKACECTEPEKKPEEPPPPWTFKLRLGSVFQLANSYNVVGRVDGTSRSFSADLHFEANWLKGDHNIRNRVDATAVIVKTQNTGRWVPAADFVELENIYQFRALPWIGPFTRLGMNTSVFVGRDLRTNAVMYALPDGTLTESRTELKLTDSFQPLTLLQSVGVFFNPVRMQELDLDFRTGIGVREVFANGQLGVQDDSETPGIVEIVDLRSYSEAGFEFIAMIRGELFDETLSYYTGGEFLLPVVRSKQPGDDRSAFDLISKTFRAGIAYKLAKKATILYEIRLVHQPQLIDVYQIQNNFGFKATFDLL